MNTPAIRLVHLAPPLAAEASPSWRTGVGRLEEVPPAPLEEARELRDGLAALLVGERAATAAVILALADFDQRRGWEALGHASLFAFLHRELRLSKGAAYLRFTAARLVPRFPEIERALRDGLLCLSAVGELARVLTPENQAEVLPRFFGCSSREAREVAAALVPRAEQPRREVVTVVRARAVEEDGGSSGRDPGPHATSEAVSPGVRAHELAPAPRPATATLPPPPIAVEPLDAHLRRLHLTVSRRLLAKLEKARDGLSHALPCATTEQVLEAALDLLLERQDRQHALVRNPRPARVPSPHDEGAPDLRAIPADVERAVRLRDGNRCQHALDAGGICGSTWRVQLDHAVPVALGGEATVGNLRVLCERHNLAAAERLLGAAMPRQRRSSVRPPAPPLTPPGTAPAGGSRPGPG